MKVKHYIKFTHDWEEKEFDLDAELLKQFQKTHAMLEEAGLMGGEDGIGFGNMSVRSKDPKHFVITGTGAGLQPTLKARHLALVTDYAFDRNFVRSIGLTAASSESLSHAAIYQALPKANAIIHIHHKQLWQDQQHKLPTTSELAEFGTVELARELYQVCLNQSVNKKKIIIMGGHPDGIIAFGNDLITIANNLIQQLQSI